ncbi:2Fe-2S iron-sulfur cluster-binding protein [Streptomyces sp. NPDC058867]|uniref:(2Fe-2S)-binding protein n=1 Tax=unclassified Streptomyces TaxID=2593676 RepID=UPI0036C9B333
MTDDQHGEGAPQGPARWDPLPQGDYDDGATAFVKLPEGGIDALLAGLDSPLAAPGHGYVPPPITVTPTGTAGTDPAATGTWSMPAGGVQWPEANTGHPGGAGGAGGAGGVGGEEAGDDRFTYHPGNTGQWTFEDASGAGDAPGHPGGGHPGAGHDGGGREGAGQHVTGQWSIPLAGGDLPDESGEFTTSSLVEQWGGNAPATLPGGAPAPWANQSIGEPWGRPADAPAEHTGEPDAPHAHAPGGPVPAQHAQEAHEGAPAGSQGAPEAREADGTDEDAHEPENAVEGPQEAPESPDFAATGDTAGTSETAGTGDSPDFADGDTEAAAEPSLPGEEHPLASYVLRVNGVDRPVTDAWIGESLLYVLRERLGLAGAKDGCSQGECGACNVQVDGRLVASCLVPAVTAAGSEVRTVEGLAVDGQPSDVQRALARCGAVQCGFCVPGMAMTVHDLLEGNPAPTELETRQALCGNLCRCSGYRGVVDAVKDVVAEREAHSAADEDDSEEARIPHQAGPGAGGVHPSAFEGTGSPAPHDQAYGQDGGQA